MKIIKTLGLMSLICVSASCSSSKVAMKSTGAETVVEAPRNSEERLAAEIHKEVNRYRVSQGLSPLKEHRGLTKLANKHSNFMRNNAGKFEIEGRLITHYGIDGRRVLARKKYDIDSIGENVIASRNMGQGMGLAKTMVQGWISSPNHKHNLDSKWSNSGLAVCFDDNGRTFVTHLFGAKKKMINKVGGPSGW
jgi:uncharacterized protein YkwD